MLVHEASCSNQPMRSLSRVGVYMALHGFTKGKEQTRRAFRPYTESQHFTRVLLRVAHPQTCWSKVPTAIPASLHVADAFQEHCSATGGSKDILDKAAESSLCISYSAWQLSRCYRSSWCGAGVTGSGVTGAANVIGC